MTLDGSIGKAKPVAYVETIISGGRVTLRKPIRDKLHLGPGDKSDVVVEGDGLRITPVNAPVTQLKGMVPKPTVPVSLEEMDIAIARAAARRGALVRQS